ncbi:MAG: YihY/virulence factor BrkB family protein [Victivallales bacterium]|jgi:membrane protein|nr:YihY/virulence factor BrkB family protein [Victivallales bacterium]
MRGGKIQLLFSRYVIGSDRAYNELGPLGKLTRLCYLSTVRFSTHQSGLRAVALTYYTLFAIVPMLALAFGIAKGFALQEKLQYILSEKLANQREILEWIYQFADTTLKQAQSGVIAGVGVIVLIWTVMGLAGNVEKSFNSIWDLPPRRNLFRRFSDYLSLILITPFVIIVLSSAGPVLRRVIGSSVPFGFAGAVLISLLVNLSPLILIILTFTLIYFISPNTRVRFLSALLGGIIAGVLFQLLQRGFIILQTKIYHYNMIYGSFAVLPLFLIWLKLSWQIALFGVEVSFIHQHVGSGLFDRLGKVKLSIKLRREYQLQLLGKIFSAFERNNGAVSEESLLKELPLPPVLISDLLDELVAANVIYKLNPEDATSGYLPARPAERCTICDAIAMLDKAGLTESPTGNSMELEKIARCLGTIQQDASRSSGNLSLKEL